MYLRFERVSLKRILTYTRSRAQFIELTSHGKLTIYVSINKSVMLVSYAIEAIRSKLFPP